jgi:hypothetical protein
MSLVSTSLDSSQIPEHDYPKGILISNNSFIGSRLKTYLAIALVFIMVSTSFTIEVFPKPLNFQ